MSVDFQNGENFVPDSSYLSLQNISFCLAFKLDVSLSQSDESFLTGAAFLAITLPKEEKIWKEKN